MARRERGMTRETFEGKVYDGKFTRETIEYDDEPEAIPEQRTRKGAQPFGLLIGTGKAAWWFAKTGVKLVGSTANAIGSVKFQSLQMQLPDPKPAPEKHTSGHKTYDLAAHSRAMDIRPGRQALRRPRPVR